MGIDAVDVSRMAVVLQRTPSLIIRLFTPDERVYCKARGRPVEHFAGRFAAKEAAMKALGVGLGSVGWHDIDVVRAPSGAPELELSGRALGLATSLGASAWKVSLTHTSTVAHAIVVLVDR